MITTTHGLRLVPAHCRGEATPADAFRRDGLREWCDFGGGEQPPLMVCAAWLDDTRGGMQVGWAAIQARWRWIVSRLSASLTIPTGRIACEPWHGYAASIQQPPYRWATAGAGPAARQPIETERTGWKPTPTCPPGRCTIEASR